VAVNKNKIIAQAQKFTAKGQFEKAITEYQKLLKADPNDIRTWLKMGDLYTRMGARKEATQTYLRVAEHYKKSGFHLKAVAVYKQVLKLDPTLIDIYELLGDAYLSLGLTSEALIQLEQLADMLQRMELPDRMLKVLMRMAEIDPQNIATRLRIAEHLSKEDKSAEAVEQFGIACNQLRQQGRIDDFLKVAERLLYHDGSRVDVARETASFYMEQGQYKRALSKLQMCFAKDPRDLTTLELLAEAFIGLQQSEKAVSVYNEMSHILADQDREEERRAVLERVLELDPKNEIALKSLGRMASQAPPLESPGALDLPSPAAAATGAVPSPAPAPVVPATDSAAAELEELTDQEAAARAEKIIGETEVLLKYGLKARAIDHLNKVLIFDYYNLEAREKIKELLFEDGDEAGAIEQLMTLAEGFREEQPEGSVFFLHQVLAIDPAHDGAREFLKQIGGVMPEGLEDEPRAAAEAPAFDDLEPVEAAGASEVEFTALSVDEPTAEPASTEVELVEPEQEWIPEADGIADDLVLGEGHPETSDILDLSDDQIVEEGGAILGDEELVPLDDDEVLPLDEDEDVLELVEEEEQESPPAPAVPPRPPVPSRPPTAPTPPTPPPPPPPPKAAPAAPAAPAAEPDISEELEEIDFFLEQELVEEAQGILDDLLAQYPQDPRLAEVAASIATAGGEEQPGEEPQESGLDLDELADGLELDDISTDDMINEIDEVFSQFKAGVQEQISKSDYATHYDLGIAYREMGLFDDAINEFEIAIGDPTRYVQSVTMIGLCLVSLGRGDDAIAKLENALEQPQMVGQEQLALLYELGKVHEALGHVDVALELFNQVLNTDPGFADVADRIDALS
jgi:tetratricopeptide (TPR) repeat protein